mmetsp:Transcript_39369/g.29079  ORF Transcript_39369/g.29079 Transcript_39369/m.29079 type:complete len:99 (+) Transcript_39369:571-867(+)
MLMKELEELAKGKPSKGFKGASLDDDGGNTSFESLMDETPSNYNLANQRFVENENMRQRAKGGKGDIIRENMDVESDDLEATLKKKRIKKKKKKNVPA